MKAVPSFVLNVVRVSGWRFWAAVSLTVGQAFSAGLAMLALLPLAQAAGVGAPAGTHGTSRLFDAVLAVTGRTPSLGAVLLVFVALTAAQDVLSWLHTRVTVRVSQDLVRGLRRRLFTACCRARWDLYVRYRHSDLLAGLTQQIDRAGYAVFDGLSLTAATVMACVYLALAVSISMPLTLLVVATGAALALVLRSRRRTSTRVGRELVEQEQRFFKIVSESLASMKLIRSYAAEDRQIPVFEGIADDLWRTQVRLAGSPAAVRVWFDVGAALILSVVAYAGLRDLHLLPAELFVLLVLFVRLWPQISSLLVYYQTLLGGLPAHDVVMRLESELAASMEQVTPRQAIAFRAAIRLRSVAFHYDERLVLESVDLVIPAGRTVALVGPSGSGKTTVADIVIGLLRPSAGALTIDDVDLQPPHLASWREQVGYVSQDMFLFHDTIRANLLWAAPGVDETAMWSALRASAADFVANLPQGLDTLVGDRGALLSGGERQRLALARALLRRPKLLVLDEATNALDSENEQVIQEAIERLRGQTAILLISHRLASVRHADTIYVLDAGRIVEQGTWTDLIARGDSRLRALSLAQGAEA